jgi:oligopeptide transport system permease protein
MQPEVSSQKNSLAQFLSRLGPLLGIGCVFWILAAISIDLSDHNIPATFWWGAFTWFFISAVFAVIHQNAVKYVSKRLIEALVTVWVIATLTFLLLRFLPGGPFDQEKTLPPEIKANIERKYGLNEPLTKQYTDYIVKLVHGDLGESYKYIGRSVTDIIKESFPVSFQLGFYSLMLAFLIGVPLGIFAAGKHNTFWDSAAMILAVSGVALPSFVFGPLLVLIFCFGVPFESMRGLLPPALWDGPIYYILPVITLGIRPAAIIARLMRSSVLEVIHADFVRTAKAKGLTQKVVMYKHVLKNSLLPVITISGPLCAGVLSGSFVNEIIFAVPGMGKHLVQSVTNRDYPLVLGLTLIYAILLVLANLVVDLLYVVVDPRIKL